MTDDPRDILRAAGVECAEVEAWMATGWWCDECGDEHEHDIGADSHPSWMDHGDAAVFSLARLVAKYKWQRDEAATEWASYEDDYLREHEGYGSETLEDKLADLDLRWEELHS